MRWIDANTVHTALDYTVLTDALEAAFRAGGEVPVRHHHNLEPEGPVPPTLLLMPAWQAGGPIGVKAVTVFAGNAERGLPAVHALFLLFDGTTGAPLAVIDGPALTERRTAAASALAARYLARADAAHLVMVGAGKLAPHLVRAHAAVRPISRISVWNRTPERAAALAADLRGEGFDAVAADDLEAVVPAADIVSCATLATEPLIQGAWLSPGTHLDLVGAFKPTMRECDDEAVRRARLYVDVMESALTEGGDLVGPLARGVISRSQIVGDFAGLTRGEVPGRTSDAEITLFKSVGNALEDLTAAQTVLDRS